MSWYNVLGAVMVAIPVVGVLGVIVYFQPWEALVILGALVWFGTGVSLLNLER